MRVHRGLGPTPVAEYGGELLSPEEAVNGQESLGLHGI
jgi:hypothetical protein